MKPKFVFIAGMWCVASTFAWAQPQLSQGKEFLQQGKVQAALLSLRQAVTNSPKDPSAWFWLGEAYLQAGKSDSAEYVADKILDLNDKMAEGYLLSAKAKLAGKNFNGAITILRQGLKLNKQNPALLRQLGETFVACDSSDRAIIAFAQAQRAEPNNPAAYEALGDIYMKQAGSVMAIMNYEKAVELDSLQTTLQHKLARAYVGERRYNEAARTYQRLIKLDTTNQAARFELARLYFASKQYAKTIPLLQSYGRAYPASLEAWSMYVEALYLSKQYKDVPLAARKLLELQPNAAKTLRMLAHAYFEMRDFDQTIAVYQQVGRQETLQGDELKRLGKAYNETKRDSLAAQAYEEALRQGVSGAELYGELGAIYMRRRQFDKAAAMFEKRFLQDSTVTSAYVNYALSNMALGKWDLARVALYRALKLKPDYVQGHLFLARTLSQMDSLSRARKECESVVKLAGAAANVNKNELAEAHGMIGFALLLEKKYPEAIESLKAALRFKDDNPQTHLWLAQAFALSNRQEEAIAEYRIVLKLDPKNKEAKKNLALIEQ